MNLTEENKKEIDSLTYNELLMRWNQSTPRNIWFRGETGKYFRERMEELKPNTAKNDAFHQYY